MSDDKSKINNIENNIEKNDENALSKTKAGKVENPKISKAQKENEMIAAIRKKRIESMTDEEIIEENLKAILEKRSQEERKANGRLIAVLVACLLIFLAIYHAWIRKTAVLAGVLVPAIIMLGYGGWVVILAKRDKRKRQMFQKHIEEVALKNKLEFEKKSLANKTKSSDHHKPKTKLHFENEISKKNGRHSNLIKPNNVSQTVTVEIENNNKQQKLLGSKIVNKDGQIKRPSIRQKLFRQTPKENLNNRPKLLKENEILIHEKRKRLQRMDTIQLPPVVRMSSAP